MGITGLSHAEHQAARQLGYEIVRFLDEGTFGSVVKARRLDPYADVPEFVAVNIFKREHSASPARSALTEIEIYTSIWLDGTGTPNGSGHPFIIELYSTNVSLNAPLDDTIFEMALMMEFCELGNLTGYQRRYFGRSRRWHQEASKFLAEVLLALYFLHNIRGVIYRDLKLDNLLVVLRGGEHHIKLGDFGVGRIIGNYSGLRSVTLAGTPYFCAPEMLARQLGRRLYTTADLEKSLDVFSFGTLVYALLQGPGFCDDSIPPQQEKRSDHPMCHADGLANCLCPGCKLLRALKVSADEDSVKQLISSCVARDPQTRPQVANLRDDPHPFFTSTDFGQLLQLA